jgi:hypothetical protein
MTGKILSLFLTFLLLIILVSTANAQTSTTTSSSGTVNNASKLKEQMQLLQDQKIAAVSQARDEFKAKLQVIKDQRKKILVERIDAKLARVNKKQTERFSEVLTRLQGFLNNIKQSTTDTKVLADIAAAQTAIDAAKAAVDVQAAKTYIIQITDDATLRLNVGTTVSQFRQDLMATYKLVIDAKQAVQKLNTDKSLMRKEATNSAKTNL